MGVKHMRSCVVLVALMLIFVRVCVAEAATSTAKPGCPPSCGNVEIPYPFGIGSSCFHDESFEVVCGNKDTPLLKNFNNVEITRIEFPRNAAQAKEARNWYIHINNPIMASNSACASRGKANTSHPLDFTGSPFHFSTKNEFGASGCINQAWLKDRKGNNVGGAGCSSTCREDAETNGLCCQKGIPDSVQLFKVLFKNTTDSTAADVGCRYAMLGLIEKWMGANLGSSCSSTVETSGSLPALLEWGLKTSSNEAQELLLQSEAKDATIGVDTHTYRDGSHIQFAFCLDGFQGSPYVKDGCQDVAECRGNTSGCPIGTYCDNSTFGSYKCIRPTSKSQIAIIVACTVMGVLLLILGVWGGFKVMKRRKVKKFFVENGGLLLESEGRTRLFKAEELITATNNFSKNNLLGQGGQGTVYRGTLSTGKTVAIKQCKNIQPSNNKFKNSKGGGFDESRESGDEIRGGAFITEVVLLSETIHKNIVRLLGCCLETESPLLVYEYLINGDLSHHLQNDRNHNNADQFTLSWETRLRIAAEVAEGLSYLHLWAGVGIYHRDVKTDNILLDNKYTAKLADFGISKSISVNQSHVSVVVQGSPGYMDPEYMDSKQYNDKSDVYSFGVVLAELLTGKKPVFSYMSQETGEERAVVLAYHFKKMDTAQIMGTFLDARVKHQGMKSEVEAVIEIAKRCLEKEGRNRPKMKDVAMELEKIREAQTNIYAEEIDEYDYEQSVEPMSTPPRDKEITRPLRDQGSQLSDANIC